MPPFRFEGSLRVMLANAISHFTVEPSATIADAAVELLGRWPLAAAEAQQLWTAAFGLVLLHGGDGDALRAVTECKPKTRLSAGVARWRRTLLPLFADAADRLSRPSRARAPKDAALARALKAWHASRTPVDAAAVEARGDEVGSGEPLPRRKLQVAWLAALDEQGADGFARIAGDLPNGNGSEIAARARALLAFADDPRMAAAGAAAIARPIVPLGSGNVAWPAVAALLAVHADPRSLAAARALTDEAHEFGWIEILVKRRVPARSLDAPAATPAPAPKKTSGTPRTIAEWERWVLDEPDDDSRREVFRDWLLERNDPRGELLALQLGGSPDPRREAALVKKHARDWLLPLGRAVVLGTPPRFERGFAIDVTICSTVAATLPDASHPLWSAVRAIRFAQWDAPATAAALAAFLRAPRLAGLRSLRGLPETLFERVLEAPAAGLEVLGGELEWRGDGKAFVRAFRAAKLPKLVELEVANAPRAAIEAVMATPAGKKLRALAINTTDGLRELLRAKTKLDRVVAFGGWEGTRDFDLTFTRDADGARWSLVARANAPRYNPEEQRAAKYDRFLIEPLRALGARVISSLTLDVPPAFQPPAVHRKLLASVGA